MSWWYSDEHDVLFNHIPKCAGISIRKGYFGRADIIRIDPRVLRKFPISRSFAIVRHPLDRFASAIRYCTARGWLPKDRPIERVANVLSRELEIGKATNRARIQEYFLPQTHELNYLSVTRYRGQFEDLNADWRIICERLDLPHERLKVMNATDPKRKLTWRDAIPEQYIEPLVELYAQDFKELGYDL